MSETDIQRQIQLALSHPDRRLFRNTIGFGFQGSDFTVRNGRVVSGVARPVTFGLCPGSGDLIGLQSVIVTPEMTGRRVALFTSIEVKDKKKPTTEQQNFAAMVAELGGISGVARSPEEAFLIVTRFTK